MTKVTATALTIEALDEIAAEFRHMDDLVDDFFSEINKLDLQLSEGLWTGGQ